MTPDVLDEHFYMRATESFGQAHHYDKLRAATVPRSSWENGPRAKAPHAEPGSSLGDAAWMTGLERNSDLVVMATYAPLSSTSIPAPCNGRLTSSATMR